MIKVVSASPEVINLPELNDRIYYKQEKTFTEIDYKRSHTLRNAIDQGNILILERALKNNKEYGAPPVSEVDIAVATPEKVTVYTAEEQAGKKPHASDDSKIDLLLNKIASLESKLEKKDEKTSVDSSALDIILDRLKNLETRVSGGGSSEKDNEQLMETLKNLESKIVQGSNTDGLVSKLESVLKRAGKTGEEAPSIDLETYVPKVTVEDANSHINLKVRTIEKSDDVNSSLAALKKLKKKR